MKSNRKDVDKKLLVTIALPYANADLHLGHMVEAVQTDIYVRTQKMSGREVRYIGADDTHGTPIELNAMKQGISPEELIAKAWDSHTKDYDAFGIDFDIYHSTNSDENREWAEKFFYQLKAKNLIFEKTIDQYYCDHDKRFLPDRFIKGLCPKCGAEDQYGDNCEVCGTTYDAETLGSPACVLCGNAPTLKQTSHFFIDMASKQAVLKSYLESGNVIQKDMKAFIMNWADDLQPRCISRDAPYFGFKIPGTENKFFYVWLDAPVGYVSSTDKWCQDNGRDVMEFWGSDADAEVVHVIGKDIVYFHTILWPIMLDAMGLKKPSRVLIHGFLTVEGEKMSKSRGTFILAKDYLDHVKHPDAAEFLRLYFAGKLSGGNNDFDFNVDEFVNRVNTLLCNNIGNFVNRFATFVNKSFDGVIPVVAPNTEMVERCLQAESDFFGSIVSTNNYRVATETLQELGFLANKYFQDSEPWKLMKAGEGTNDYAKAQEVLTTCAYFVRSLGTLLKPIVPVIATRVETVLNEKFSFAGESAELGGRVLGRIEKVALPLEKEMFDELYKSDVVVPPREEPKEDEITFDQFLDVKTRVGIITAAEKMKKSKKMMKIQLADGYKIRQIMSGIAEHYSPEELVGKKVVFVSNLKPAKLMGQLSEGMILAAENEAGELALVTVDKEFDAGASVA